VAVVEVAVVVVAAAEAALGEVGVALVGAEAPALHLSLSTRLMAQQVQILA